jgi:tRNA (cytidine/uridine-2'-O-)-methyltransferase
MFGAETSGLPEQAHAAATHMVKIPMSEQHVRSLNLATSVGIGVMEALRQKDGAVLPEHEA